MRRPRQLLDDCVHIEHMPVRIVHLRPLRIVCRPRIFVDLQARTIARVARERSSV